MFEGGVERIVWSDGEDARVATAGTDGVVFLLVLAPLLRPFLPKMVDSSVRSVFHAIIM